MSKETCGKEGCSNPSIGTVWGDLLYQTCDEHKDEIDYLTRNE